MDTQGELAAAAEITPRISSGVAAIDRRLGGGLPPNRAVVVSGGIGTGKTTFCLQFLSDGITAGERGLLAIVDQKPRHVIEDARGFGFDLDAWINARTLRLLDASPYFAAFDKPNRTPTARDIAADLAGQLKSFRASRLVIDPVTSLVPRDQSPGSVREFLRTLVFALEDNLGVTSLLLAPHTGGAMCAGAILEELSSGVIEMSMVERDGQLRRVMRILKMRGTAVEPFELDLRLVSGKGLVPSSAHGSSSDHSG